MLTFTNGNGLFRANLVNNPSFVFQSVPAQRREELRFVTKRQRIALDEHVSYVRICDAQQEFVELQHSEFQLAEVDGPHRLILRNEAEKRGKSRLALKASAHV